MGQICVVPRKCSTDYMELFYIISHPFMSPAQPRDPPRLPPKVHDDTFVEPDVPQHPVLSVLETILSSPYYYISRVNNFI